MFLEKENEKFNGNKAQLLVKNGEFGTALLFYKKAYKLGGLDLNQLLDYGMLLVKMGENENGFKVLSEAKEKSDDYICDVYLGSYYLLIGNNDLAKKSFLLAIRKKPDLPLWIHYYAGKPNCDPIVNHKYKVVFFPIPKCGCTTIKNFFYKMDCGKETINPHPQYTNQFKNIDPLDFDAVKDYYKFAIVRDPISRFLSYFQNNITDGESLYRTRCYAKTKNRYIFGLDRNPSLDKLIENLEFYIYCFNDIRHHALCQSAYLKMPIALCDDIFTLKDLPIALEKLEKITGISINNRHLRKSKRSADDLYSHISPKAKEKLIKYYSEDYDLLKKFIPPRI
jgi:tetratricopeptide (TPR) repeat protein